MVNYLDTGVGKIVDALKAKDMWDNTIWVSWHRRNPSPLRPIAECSNRPVPFLRCFRATMVARRSPETTTRPTTILSREPSACMQCGEAENSTSADDKPRDRYSNWEGGIRVNAFVSGGYIAKVAPAMVGQKLDGFVSIADW